MGLSGWACSGWLKTCSPLGVQFWGGPCSLRDPQMGSAGGWQGSERLGTATLGSQRRMLLHCREMLWVQRAGVPVP